MSFLVFEANIPDKFTISLSIDSPNFDSILSFGIISISVIETLMSSTPYLQIKFVDASGYLISKYPILPDDEFIFTYGTTPDNIQTTTFKLSTIEFDLSTSSDTGSVIVSSSMLHSNWDKIFKKSHQRSWRNKHYSDIITDLADEIGFDEYDIEPTLNTYDVIQPYWTNSQFLKWLADNSVNSNQIGGYVYGMTANNKFFFKTYDSLYSEATGTPKKFIYDVAAIIPNGFNNITILNRYMPIMSHNGFGTKHSHFDYNTKEYVTDTTLVTDINERQLSDWYYIAESHNEESSFYDGGRNPHTINNVQNKVLNSTNSIHQMSISVNGDPETHIGDIIELEIPVSRNFDENEDAFVNSQYSGYWMVWKAVQQFDVSRRMYLTKLYLSRSGINGLSILGLVQTPVGKSVS